MTDIKENIINTAVNKLKDELNIQILLEEPHKTGIPVDKEIHFTINGGEQVLYAEVRKRIEKQTIGLLQLNKKQLKDNYLLITEYVNLVVAEKLKEKNIQFIDTAGNAYINQYPLYIFLKGQKMKKGRGRKKTRRIFYPAGLKVIYLFLCIPEAVNWRYREIAEKADVALGTIAWLMKDLKELGYLADMQKKGKRIVKKEELLKEWCTQYIMTLKPKCFLGTFTAAKGNIQDIKIDKKTALWGGEPAAAEITKYLTPERMTIYTTAREMKKIVIENKLKADENGKVEIVERFWDAVIDDKNKDTVNPVLVYADLLETGAERNVETAKMIYEQFIHRHIR